jgi:mono/diheme cytochrome c family protein
MEELFFYLMGASILAICLLAGTLLKRLNHALNQNNFQKTDTLITGQRLQASIRLANLVFIVVSVLVGLGLATLYLRGKKKTTLPAAIATTETPKSVVNSLDLATATVLTDEASLKAGAETFKNLCAACHGQAGEGLVGPNFTDTFWLHGGEFKDLCKIVVEGVPDKGMISWANQLSGEQIKQVTSFILSLEGSNPPNPKAAQGAPFKRNETIPFAIRPATVAAVKIPSIPLKGNKQKGETLFNGTLGCGHCHGPSSVGHVDNRNLRGLQKRYAGDAQKVYDTAIEIGRMGTAMPPWNHLTLEQKQDIKTFIFSIQEQK